MNPLETSSTTTPALSPRPDLEKTGTFLENVTDAGADGSVLDFFTASVLGTLLVGTFLFLPATFTRKWEMSKSFLAAIQAPINPSCTIGVPLPCAVTTFVEPALTSS